MGHKETEQAAISHVIALERAVGRDPKDVRSSGLPYDDESSPRVIGVKAFSRSARGEVLPLEGRSGATRRGRLLMPASGASGPLIEPLMRCSQFSTRSGRRPPVAGQQLFGHDAEEASAQPFVHRREQLGRRDR
ncbi:hypothetical protein AB0L59_01825 [Streptomyces sp. NPDC052109]|uniref:hypothetical protein n=1 Tax=Streptomyces sp. NPDC052109 TaxID=3155527 RepID=UPI0034149AB6